MLVAILALVAAAATPVPPRVVVLVTLDTTRADQLGCYGYARPTSPFLDSLAARGVLFENAFAAIAHTGPSHAALLSGLHPAQTGIRENGQGFPSADVPADSGLETLAERFEAAGYATAAFTGVSFLAPLTRGFRYVNVGSGDEHAPYRRADATITQVTDWLQLQEPGRRLFAWVHVYDPHLPARAPGPHADALRFPTRGAGEAFARTIAASRGIPPSAFAGPAELAAAYAAYDAELRFADAELRRLHDFMRRRGLLRDAWWIVAGDHGEGLGQHGYQEHSQYVYTEQLHVPLIFAGTGLPPGRRLAGVAQLLDLWPTLVSLLGQQARQPAHAVSGISLLPALRGEQPLPARQVYAERRPRDGRHLFFEPGDLFAIHDLDWKYIAKTEGEDELYDLRRDPLELRNAVRAATPVRERLERAAREAWARLKADAGRLRPPPPDPSLQDELRALGYVN